MNKYFYIVFLFLAGCEPSSNQEFVRFEDKLKINDIVQIREQKLRDSLQNVCDAKMDSIAIQAALPQIQQLKKRKKNQK